MERNRSFDSFNNKLLQRPLHPRNDFLPRLPRHDQLGNHRIIIGWNGIAAVHVAVNPDTMTTGEVQIRNFTRRWPESIGWIFGIDAALHRETVSAYNYGPKFQHLQLL